MCLLLIALLFIPLWVSPMEQPPTWQDQYKSAHPLQRKVLYETMGISLQEPLISPPKPSQNQQLINPVPIALPIATPVVTRITTPLPQQRNQSPEQVRQNVRTIQHQQRIGSLASLVSSMGQTSSQSGSSMSSSLPHTPVSSSASESSRKLSTPLSNVPWRLRKPGPQRTVHLDTQNVGPEAQIVQSLNISNWDQMKADKKFDALLMGLKKNYWSPERYETHASIGCNDALSFLQNMVAEDFIHYLSYQNMAYMSILCGQTVWYEMKKHALFRADLGGNSLELEHIRMERAMTNIYKDIRDSIIPNAMCNRGGIPLDMSSVHKYIRTNYGIKKNIKTTPKRDILWIKFSSFDRALSGHIKGYTPVQNLLQCW